jgi:hypothetical protein
MKKNELRKVCFKVLVLVFGSCRVPCFGSLVNFLREKRITISLDWIFNVTNMYILVKYNLIWTHEIAAKRRPTRFDKHTFQPYHRSSHLPQEHIWWWVQIFDGITMYVCSGIAYLSLLHFFFCAYYRYRWP